MIRISQIDDEFSVYRDKLIILWGKIGPQIKDMIDTFKYHDLNVSYICDFNHGSLIRNFDNIPVIQSDNLDNFIKDLDTNVVIQITTENVNKATIDELNTINRVDSVISFEEASFVFDMIRKIDLIKKYPYVLEDYRKIYSNTKNVEKTKTYDFVNRNPMEDELLFVCSPPKTGDTTLTDTFKSFNIRHQFIRHAPEAFNKEFFSSMPCEIKIITGIREPIARDLSGIYQNLAASYRTRVSIIDKYHKKNESIFKNGGDAQEIFTLLYDGSNPSNQISNFMDRFKNNIMNLSFGEFDSERGYSIFDEGNIQVFVYQLEKLNNIISDMSQWIGKTPINKWMTSNTADGKWIANSYKQAQNEIKFSQNYFDVNYDNPWIKHFYSKSDIEKFKDKWHKHISNDVLNR